MNKTLHPTKVLIYFLIFIAFSIFMLKVILYEDRILSSKFGVLFVLPILVLFCMMSAYNFMKKRSFMAILPLMLVLFYFVISLMIAAANQLF